MTRNSIIAALVAALGLLASPVRAADAGMGFSFDVSLSDKAAAKLAAMKEKIAVAIEWAGEPTKAAAKRADEMGQIHLGSEKARLSGVGGHVDISGRSIPPSHVGWVKDRRINVNVNVYSARLGGPDNVLDCDLFDDDLEKARTAPVAIRCKLIGEK